MGHDCSSLQAHLVCLQRAEIALSKRSYSSTVQVPIFFLISFSTLSLRAFTRISQDSISATRFTTRASYGLLSTWKRSSSVLCASPRAFKSDDQVSSRFFSSTHQAQVS